MDAAADGVKAALTPFKRTLPSPLHLHLKGRFTQISPRSPADGGAGDQRAQGGGTSIRKPVSGDAVPFPESRRQVQGPR